MKIYLDDCAYSRDLAERLRQAGHDVTLPVDVGLREEEDHVHFAYAAQQGLVLLTKNPADFLELHELNSGHAGIIGIYQDNDVTRDMTEADIVRAIDNLATVHVQSGTSLAGQFHNLNRWRLPPPKAKRGKKKR